jgi:peroxiredoxin
MALLEPGATAPAIDGWDRGAGPIAVFFYKVSCPVCQMAAPMIEGAAQAYPGRIVGVGEDPPSKLDAFAREFGLSFGSVPDLAPYPASSAYGLEAVPSLFVIDDDGTIVESVESWDLDGYNRASRTLAALTGSPYREVSNDGDGLPAFRPG